MVSYYPGMNCVDKHRLQYQQSTRSTPKIRSPPTTPAMSIPNQKLFSSQYLKYFSIQYWFSQLWLHFQSNLLPMHFYMVCSKFYLLGHNECPSSVPSAQWFIESHTKSDDIQNSDDLQRNSLHAWSVNSTYFK